MASGKDQRPRCGELCVPVVNLPLHELERSDELVKLAKFVVDGVIQGSLRGSHTTATQRKALKVQPRYSDFAFSNHTFLVVAVVNGLGYAECIHIP